MAHMATLHRGPRRTTVVDDRSILSMVKKNPFHNMQPSEEHSPGGRTVTVYVYNQEKTIQSKYRGFSTRYKQIQIRLWQTTSKKNPEHFWKSILWMAEIKFNLYQNDGMKKVWSRLGTAHDPTTSSVKHGGAVCMSMHGFQWHLVTGV